MFLNTKPFLYYRVSRKVDRQSRRRKRRRWQLRRQQWQHQRWQQYLSEQQQRQQRFATAGRDGRCGGRQRGRGRGVRRRRRRRPGRLAAGAGGFRGRAAAARVRRWRHVHPLRGATAARHVGHARLRRSRPGEVVAGRRGPRVRQEVGRRHGADHRGVQRRRGTVQTTGPRAARVGRRRRGGRQIVFDRFREDRQRRWRRRRRRAGQDIARLGLSAESQVGRHNRCRVRNGRNVRCSSTRTKS